MVKDKKLYDILEINPEATEQEIKKSYFKLSKVWHPDRNPPEDKEKATAKFQEISDAYNILSDADKRKLYDTTGMTDQNNNHGFDPADLFGAFGGMGGMGDMFGGMGGRRRQEDCMVEQYVTLEELFTNKKIPVKYKQKVFCNKCNGTGSKDGKSNECKGCNGKGQKIRMIKQGNMIQQITGGPCDDCGGTGEKVIKDNLCPDCFGNKNIIKEKTFELQLNKKLSNNDKIVVENMGHQLKTGTTNLVIIIKEQPHPVFKRRGNNLYIDMKLRLFQSVYGFSKTLTHLDGNNIVLKYDKMLSHMTTTMKISGAGMNSTGDLFINIYTHMPKLDRLDEQENNILKKLMIKMHLSEYVKDQNVSKNEEKLQTFNMIEIEKTAEKDRDTYDMDNGMAGGEMRGGEMRGGEMPAQCVQQ